MSGQLHERLLLVSSGLGPVGLARLAWHCLAERTGAPSEVSSVVTVPTTLAHLHRCTADEFVTLVGPVFERSPWIAAAVVDRRPFVSRAALHAALCDVVRGASQAQQLALIRAHPDLVGRSVRAWTLGQATGSGLTSESEREQAAAGLLDLGADDLARFDRYNTAYTARFGFPFVICARQQRKEAILQAFPERLTHDRDTEIAIALDQIFAIAELRLADLLPDPSPDPPPAATDGGEEGAAR